MYLSYYSLAILSLARYFVVLCILELFLELNDTEEKLTGVSSPCFVIAVRSYNIGMLLVIVFDIIWKNGLPF